jgi:hypothetical protein
MRALGKFVLVILLVAMFTAVLKVASAHKCIDKQHIECDGKCDCDGMECKK